MDRNGMTGDRNSNDVTASGGLLGAADPPAVEIINPLGPSPFLLIGDHAGNAIPQMLGTLGLNPPDLERHIAWDIGIAALGLSLSEKLDAPFIGQRYSRLVIDCNRDPLSPEAVPQESDGTQIPGNREIDPAHWQMRVGAIHTPYQYAIRDKIARRAARHISTTLISLHSFTPALAGQERPWHVGVLHGGGHDRFARRLLDRLQQNEALIVGDNEPYQMDSTDHTVPRHAFPKLPYAELEVAQAILGRPEDVEGFAVLLATALSAAL
jgi:predicted N-formylglutamate amidohydrolase